MLLYVVFCCLILVQVKGTCLLSEFITLIRKLNNRDLLATCILGEYKNLSFPTNWTGCKWSCLDKGLADITENFNKGLQAKNFKPSAFRCNRYSKLIKDMQITFETPKCSSIQSCREHCGHSPGNIHEYLKEVRETLQSIQKQQFTQQNSTSHVS